MGWSVLGYYSKEDRRLPEEIGYFLTLEEAMVCKADFMSVAERFAWIEEDKE